MEFRSNDVFRQVMDALAPLDRNADSDTEHYDKAETLNRSFPVGEAAGDAAHHAHHARHDVQVPLQVSCVPEFQ
ncbi:hypothetical protein ACIBKY_13720 [Nonomuraea sp. NPDC050394]|uniref:hypothetical protein n=1 Tax=Nonomuraea sp. NPDC050394 TaxID=3364363 RepID=UPI00379AAA41